MRASYFQPSSLQVGTLCFKERGSKAGSSHFNKKNLILGRHCDHEKKRFSVKRGRTVAIALGRILLVRSMSNRSNISFL